jgi:hypothetical protein
MRRRPANDLLECLIATLLKSRLTLGLSESRR